jgi:hypothetical protein
LPWPTRDALDMEKLPKTKPKTEVKLGENWAF